MKRYERVGLNGEKVEFLEPESEEDLLELRRLSNEGKLAELGSFAESSRKPPPSRSPKRLARAKVKSS
jgi:hypothetical protein